MALKRRRNPSLIPISLRALAGLGCEYVDKCESYVSYAAPSASNIRGHRRDLFGLADIVGIEVGRRIFFVQVCSKGAISSHVSKIKEHSADVLRGLLSVPCVVFEVWGWYQANGFGTKWLMKRVRAEVLQDGELSFRRVSEQ